jgi:hypothetical protein
MRGNGRVISAARAAGACSALTLAVAAAGPAAAVTTGGAVHPAAGPAAGAAPVIIFLKDPRAEAPSPAGPAGRLALKRAAQAPYLAQLARLGATSVHGYRLANAIAARVPASALAGLAASPGVASVIPDSPVAGPGLAQPGQATPSPRQTVPTTTIVQTPPGACSASPQLEPEGLALTGTAAQAAGTRSAGTVTARSLGYTGAGVKVAFLADGIDPANANLMRGGTPVITDYKDFTGEGTAAATAGGAAFADASAIAGQGSAVYSVAGFSAQLPATPCYIRIQGTAPDASLVALKVFGQASTSTTAAILQAIDYAVDTAHVNVLDESFGDNPFPDVTSLDAVKEFNDMAVAAGTTVVVASGNAGPFNTIGSPASDPAVISVGASTGFQFYAQTDFAGADQFAPGGWESGNISSQSSGGFTQNGRTLDLVAPGDTSFASCTPSPLYSSCVNFLGMPSPMTESDGTSQAAPLVAGAAALVIQAYRKAHRGASPAPATVKRILLSTATDLAAPAIEQGAGQLNSLRAVELAAWRPGRGRAHAGAALELSANQLNFTGRPGALAKWAVTVTNAARTAQRVAVTGRGFGSPSVVKQAVVTLSDARSAGFTNWSGSGSNYALVRFTVRRHVALLSASIAWPASVAQARNPNAPVRVILVDPAARLAAHSLPQGDAGYGSAQVLHPAAGRWTAVIFSDTARAGGTAGAVKFAVAVRPTTRFGSVSPSSLSLAPGASAVVHVSARVPASAGDSSGSVVLATGSPGGPPVTVPVTLRGRVQVGPGMTGTFSGTLGGGNGRSPGTGQVAAYSFTVPPQRTVALRNLDVDVVLANHPASQVSGYLIAPGGETVGYGSSYLTTGFTASGVPVMSPRRQLSLYATGPVAGNWTLLLDVTSPVPGNAPAVTFTGRIRFNDVGFDRGALPNSPAVTLARGKPVTYRISVHNGGAAPEDIFLDPRLARLAAYRLQPQNHVTVQLPLAANASPPEWIVPALTRRLWVSATSASPAVPVMFDSGPYPGDPDKASGAGNPASATYPAGRQATPVTPGLWYAVPSEAGPYPAAGAPGTTVTAAMSAVTEQFDTAAAPATGDFWRFGVAPLAASASYRLFVINPGQTRSIALTITPTARRGTVVRGRLYIDDFAESLRFISGSQLVTLHYAYKVRLFLDGAQADGHVHRAELVKHLVRVLGADVGKHVAELVAGAQQLALDVHPVLGEHPVDRREHPRHVLVQVDEPVGTGNGGKRHVRQVDRHRRGAAIGEVDELAGHELADVLLRLLGGAADVRGEDHVGQAAQLGDELLAVPLGLLGEHVDGRARDVPGLDVPAQRGVVDDEPA